MNGQQMLKRDFVGDLTPREGRTRRATSIAAKHAAGSPVTLVTLGAASLLRSPVNWWRPWSPCR